MSSTITIQLPSEASAILGQVCNAQRRSREQVAQDFLERSLAIVQMDNLQKELQPYAQKAGYTSEDDILNGVS